MSSKPGVITVTCRGVRPCTPRTPRFTLRTPTPFPPGEKTSSERFLIRGEGRGPGPTAGLTASPRALLPQNWAPHTPHSLIQLSSEFVLGGPMAVPDLTGPNPCLAASHARAPTCSAIWIHSNAGPPPAAAERPGLLLTRLCPPAPAPCLSANPASSTWNPPRCGRRPLPPRHPEALL